MLPANSSTTTPTTLRFRQFLPAAISRAVIVTTSARKPRSTIAAGSQPIFADKVIAMRPASHTTTNISNGVPWIGNRPVQFEIAVSEKIQSLPPAEIHTAFRARASHAAQMQSSVPPRRRTSGAR